MLSPGLEKLRVTGMLWMSVVLTMGSVLTMVILGTAAKRAADGRAKRAYQHLFKAATLITTRYRTITSNLDVTGVVLMRAPIM
jgi:bacteriorhodopsin